MCERKCLLVIVCACLFLMSSAPLFAESDVPLGYPFSSWGELRLGSGEIEEGLVLDSYFEQGIDWKNWQNWTFNSFLGLRLIQGTESDDYWNNKIGPVLGLKVTHPFQVFPGAWGQVSLGVRGEYFVYTSSTSEGNDLLVTPFFQWSFGGDWKRYGGLSLENNSNFPLAYPFSSWGELKYSIGDIEEGLVLDAYIEQGVDLYRFANHDLVLNSFVGLRLVESSEDSEYWNNKFVPRIGVKVKRPFEIYPGAWGEMSLGVRGEYFVYTSSEAAEDEFAVTLFFQWSFGGDWKNR